MALQTKERYDPKKVERLAEHLRLYQEKGQPIDFEIIVDGFKVVRRTNDPNMFSMYENFVDADSRSMEILLYAGTSNNNDKSIFFFGEVPKEGLSGVEVNNLVKEEVQQKLREKEFEDLKEENEELQEEIKDLEKEVEQLKKEKAEVEASQSPLKGFLGEVGSSFVESLIRRNPNIVKSIPGGEALAGLIDSDNKRKEREEQSQSTEETEVSFQAKSNNPVNEEGQAAITFVNQLKSQFTKDEFDQVLIILQTLADDKTKINTILQNLNT